MRRLAAGLSMNIWESSHVMSPSVTDALMLLIKLHYVLYHFHIV